MGMALSAAGQGGMTAWAAHPPGIGEIHGPMRRLALKSHFENVLSMNSHAFFNAQAWDLRSEGLSIREIADQVNLDPEVVLQRLSFDAFNK